MNKWLHLLHRAVAIFVRILERALIEAKGKVSTPLSSRTHRLGIRRRWAETFFGRQK